LKIRHGISTLFQDKWLVRITRGVSFLPFKFETKEWEHNIARGSLKRFSFSKETMAKVTGKY
jgi:hypothetical protein